MKHTWDMEDMTPTSQVNGGLIPIRTSNDNGSLHRNSLLGKWSMILEAELYSFITSVKLGKGKTYLKGGKSPHRGLLPRLKSVICL